MAWLPSKEAIRPEDISVLEYEEIKFSGKELQRGEWVCRQILQEVRKLEKENIRAGHIVLSSNLYKDMILYLWSEKKSFFPDSIYGIPIVLLKTDKDCVEIMPKLSEIKTNRQLLKIYHFIADGN